MLAAEVAELGHRVELDDRVDQSFGRRAVDWELKGVPVRVEVGPRDLAEGNVTLVRRDTATSRPVARSARRRPPGQPPGRTSRPRSWPRPPPSATTARVDVATVDEAVEAAQTGWARLPWGVVGEEGEDRLATSGVSVRCLQLPDGGLPADGLRRRPRGLRRARLLTPRAGYTFGRSPFDLGVEAWAAAHVFS